MKKIFVKIHLWLGLVSGLLVFIIAFTGALYAFQEEISNMASYKHVAIEERSLVEPSELMNIAEAQLPGRELQSVKYGGGDRAVEAIFYGYAPSYYDIVYLNPYSGEVLKVKDMQKDFFRFIITGHYYLWLPPRIGQPLVAWSTLVFLIVIISGLVIWIPKSRKALKNRVWFQWNKKTKWPRINFDLHVVGGLYASVFSIIFAITGLVWGFQWFANGFYNAIGGEKSLIYSVENPVKTSSSSVVSTSPIDSVWHFMLKEYPDYGSIEVHPVHNDSSLFSANATEKGGGYGKTDYRYFDQKSLQEVSVGNIYGRLKDANAGEKLFRMNYDIHTGAVLGIFGKTIAFLASLLIASLPITGFIIWWKKRRTKKKP